MEKKRYEPMLDRLFPMMFIPTNILSLAAVILPAIFNASALFLTLPLFVLVNYCFLSPLFGYAELREDGLFIRCGLLITRLIPYGKIRALEKERKFYTDSLLSLKVALEHVNVKYNAYDVTSLSLRDNDGFITELSARAGLSE